MHHASGLDPEVQRIPAGLRQYQAAQRLGIAPSALRDPERGRNPLTPERAAAISRVIREIAAPAARVADAGKS